MENTNEWLQVSNPCANVVHGANPPLEEGAGMAHQCFRVSDAALAFPLSGSLK